MNVRHWTAGQGYGRVRFELGLFSFFSDLEHVISTSGALHGLQHNGDNTSLS